jgi:hypothetical protein
LGGSNGAVTIIGWEDCQLKIMISSLRKI